MDHSARRSMKNAANCVKYGELQGSRNRNMSNAYCTFSTLVLEVRLSEGPVTPMRIVLFLMMRERERMLLGVHSIPLREYCVLHLLNVCESRLDAGTKSSS